MSLADQSQQWFPTSSQVTVLQARGLGIKGKNGTNDAYAIMQVAKEKYTTSVAEKSVAPMWKEDATFDLPLFHRGNTERCTLHVHVMHRALVGPDKLLGQAVINLLELHEVKSRNKTEWFKLLNKFGKADKDRGEVLLDIQFMRNNMTASMFDLSAMDKSRSRLGKFKDKLRGKKKDGVSDSASAIVPSFTQVMTDSEGEAQGDEGGEVTAKTKETKKKRKLKSLFSSKSNLQRNLSQSMSVLGPLPEKNLSVPGSRSSGVNVDSSEGKKKFKFRIHKRSESSEVKGSQGSSSLIEGDAPAGLHSVNDGHAYDEKTNPRVSRTSSTFSSTSSGRGSLEDLRRTQGSEGSFSSLDSLRPPKPHSPWATREVVGKTTEGEEEEEEDEDDETSETNAMGTIESETERMSRNVAEEKIREDEWIRIEMKRGKEEGEVNIQEEDEREEEEEERFRMEGRRDEAARKQRRDEEEREIVRLEKERKWRKEEEMIRLIIEKEEEQEREKDRMEKSREEDARQRREEERVKVAKEMEERIKREEEGERERVRMEKEREEEERRREEEKAKIEQEKAEDERKQREEERIQEEEMVRMAKEREEERIREEERVRMAKEREEERIQEEERVRMAKEREEERIQEEERVRMAKEREEERIQEEERVRMAKEREEERIQEDERMRMAKEREEERIQEEERVRMAKEREEERIQEEERMRMAKEREEERIQEEERDRMAKEREEERIQEEERVGMAKEREEERIQEEERMRMAKEREEERIQEEERVRKEGERIEMVMEREEKKRREEEVEREEMRMAKEREEEDGRRQVEERARLEEERIRIEKEREEKKEGEEEEERERREEQENVRMWASAEGERMKRQEMEILVEDKERQDGGEKRVIERWRLEDESGEEEEDELGDTSGGTPVEEDPCADQRDDICSRKPCEEVPHRPTGALCRAANMQTLEPSPPSSLSPPLPTVPANPFLPLSELEVGSGEKMANDSSERKRRAPLPPSNRKRLQETPVRSMHPIAHKQSSASKVHSVAPLVESKGRGDIQKSLHADADNPGSTRIAPQPPKGRGTQTLVQSEEIASQNKINKARGEGEEKEEEAKNLIVYPKPLVQMNAPLNKSSPIANAVNMQGSQSSTQSMDHPKHLKHTTEAPKLCKHTKGPAPSKPNSTSFEVKVLASPNIERPVHDHRRDLSFEVYGSNPFEEDENEIHPTDQDAFKSGALNTPDSFSHQTPSVMNIGSKDSSGTISQNPVDADASSSLKNKSLKTVRAPLPPEKKENIQMNQSKNVVSKTTSPDPRPSQEAARSISPSSNTQETTRTRVGELLETPIGSHLGSGDATKMQLSLQPSGAVSVAAQGISLKASGKCAGPASTSRRPHPVKPLSPLEDPCASSIQGVTDSKPTATLSGLQDKMKVKEGIVGPFSQLTQGELISLVLKQQSQLSEKDATISELEKYIDNLLVRIIEEKPSILMSMSSLKNQL